jgi:hypothetical protein
MPFSIQMYLLPIAFRLPPYGGKFDVDNIGVCEKRGERPL